MNGVSMCWLSVPVAGLLVSLVAAVAPANQFDLADGDRVVLVGNALIEQEQRHGYWEAALTRHYASKRITFRNLGWSGDTVWGEARAGFGTAADGFRSLKEQVASVKPTVLLVGYGANEAFAGASGLTRFQDGLDTLLDMLAESRARIVLLAPLRQENLRRPLPDPAQQNQNLALYRDALKRTALRRGFPFVDLYEMSGSATPSATLTDDGIHLTAYGYWRTAAVLEAGLGLAPISCRIDVGPGRVLESEGAQVVMQDSKLLQLRVTNRALPLAPPAGPDSARDSRESRVFRVQGLPAGRYSIQIDGRRVTQGTAAEWAKGITLTHGPEFDQAEQLRATIIAKNREYFHRWRPQNETYLFGFRRYEQGQNAREVPQFEPIVAQLEEKIAKLRQPVAHTYELLPLEGH
jgi:lysophospholipase L1-like esterase